MSRESTVRIVIVRPGLLGTYGDGGNATVLVQRLRWRGIDAVLIPLAGKRPVPSEADICLLGGGEDRAQEVLAGDGVLLDSLRRAAGRTVILGVCAGMQVLGHGFSGRDGGWHDGAGILDIRTVATNRTRAVGEVSVEVDPSLGIGAVNGFENHAGRTSLGPEARPLGRVMAGVGNGVDGLEGVVAGSIFGTYLHGPVLARNPAFADLLLGRVVGHLAPLDVPEADLLHDERAAAIASRRWWRRPSRRRS